MDSRFDEIFHNDPQNDIFKVVFYPDRVYHAAYFNATRSARYRYNVLEVRNAFDITVLKAEVYMDGAFLSNVLRVEYRASRLTEVAREMGRFLRDRILMQIRLLDSSPGSPGTDPGPQELLSLHYDKWINAYQTEIWQSVEPPTRKWHDFKVVDQIGRMGPITSIFAFKDHLRDIKKLRRVELAFRENDIDIPFGTSITNPQWDNNFMRNHQVPTCNIPSDPVNTVLDNTYLIDFQRGYFFEDIDELKPVRYLNGMMDSSNPEARPDNVIEMRWCVQREFASSLVFFHKVTIPPGTIEGTHRHIGTEELYCIVEGTGIAYMGDGDDPAIAKYKLVDRAIYGLGTTPCREVPVKAGSVIYTKSGGIHGIRNPSPDKPLRFVAFLYHTA